MSGDRAMKKVLIITYYWPPSGGAGVQRWLKFVKYFRRYGWEPVIYTPENPEVPVQDRSLLQEIPSGVKEIKRKILEPYSIYKSLLGLKQEEGLKAGFLSQKEKTSWKENFAVWVRGNFFIPDARRFWVRPSVRFLRKYLQADPVDVVVSTGPPHSMHLIANALHRSLGIPWLADFRDPWTNIDFYDQLKLSARADRKHKRLEKTVLKNASAVVAVSRTWAEELEQIAGRKVELIPNGYDPEDFDVLPEPPAGEYFEILHLGAINKDRNPVAFWKMLSQYVKDSPDFDRKLKIRLIGFSDYQVTQSLKKYGLYERTEIIQYMPHHQAIQNAASADVLLLLLNNTPNVKGITPGKMYEYLALKKPVFGIGDTKGDAAHILENAEAGTILDFHDEKGMRKLMEDLFAGEEVFRFGNIEKYSRINLTKQMSELLNKILKP